MQPELRQSQQEPDLRRAAESLLEQHGPRALERAEVLAMELDRCRDSHGAGVWRQIGAAVFEVQQANRRDALPRRAN